MSKRKIFFFVLILACFLAVIPFSASGIYAASAKVPPGIAKQTEQGGQADILLVLDDSDAKALAKQMRDNLGIDNDNEMIITEKARLFKEKRNRVLSGISGQDYTIVHDYDHFPVVHLRANANALQSLSAMSEVAAISEDLIVYPLYTDSQTLIGIPQAWSYASGSGASVAVVDSGINYPGSGLTACSLPGNPGCIAYEQCFATGGCWSDKSHGTNVSGIVFQVAPNSEVLALDVFRTDGSAYYSDIISALNWVMANKTAYTIVAVNMSLGGTTGYTSPCPSDGLASAISTMKGAGIATAVASGNSGFTTMITAPACGPDAISVGAVYANNYGAVGWSSCTDSTTAADQVTCFSDSASFLTILAPGAFITAGGYTMSGTSQATPFISGSVAVLKSLDNTLTVDKVVSKMTTTGVAVTDSRNSIIKPRINLYGAVGATAPIIGVNPSSVSFIGGQNGPNPANQPLNIANNGGGTLNWSISSNAAWLTPNPLTGTAPGSVTLSVNTAGLAAGSYSASLSITAPGALNSPLTVPVSLQVVNSAYTENFETGNLTKFPWTTGGNGSWTVQSSTVHTGTYAAQSPVLTTPQTSYLQVTLNVTSPGYVNFWLRTNTGSSSWQNNLKFWLDGTNQGPFAGWYGITGWTLAQSNIQVPTGVHTFKWEYSKTVSATGDAVWLDDIFFPPFNLVSISPSSKDFGEVSLGSSALQTFTVSNIGGGAAVLGAVSLTGPNAAEFAVVSDTCSLQTLAPSGNCAVGVKFTPQSLGTGKSASLSVPSNYPTASVATLTGTGGLKYTLTINKNDVAATGTGTVTSAPAGINCGSLCSARFLQGSQMTLTASPDAGSTFTGWSGGGCSGSGTCVVTLNADTTVTAIFAMIPPTANFTATPLSGTAPLAVTFTQLASANTSAWSWKFGDGSTSSLQNPVYTYSYAGTYTVSLTAANAGGTNTMTKTNYIAVSSTAYPVRIVGGSLLYFTSLQPAFNGAVTGDVIQVQGLSLTETPLLNSYQSITLKGGYDSSFTANPGYSTIHGSLAIQNSTVTVESIAIQP